MQPTCHRCDFVLCHSMIAAWGLSMGRKTIYRPLGSLLLVLGTGWLAAGLCRPLSAAELLVGAAEVSITPDKPVPLAGQMHTRISKGVEAPVMAEVLALESRQGQRTVEQAIFVSCDLAVLRGGLIDVVRGRIKGRLPDFDTNKLVMSATHTHSAPTLIEGVYELPKGDIMRPTEYFEFLARLRCFEAIDPLVALAADEDPDVYEPALAGLRSIADPDKFDLPRLVGLLLKTPPGQHRDEVEKTIVVVCQGLPKDADRAQPVLAALAQCKVSEPVAYLSLIGRLGGPTALKTIDASLASDNAEIKQAAVRALCNWPTADVADRLWQLASRPDNATFQQWALRAYVRVVTLKSDRPEAQTLAMLQRAMQVARSPEDKQWVLSRASTVRTLETLAWIAPFLDDPALDQTACQAIVEMAHHRFLRHPNMDRFGPLLEKVARLSKDPAVAERAKKYRFGL